MKTTLSVGRGGYSQHKMEVFLYTAGGGGDGLSCFCIQLEVVAMVSPMFKLGPATCVQSASVRNHSVGWSVVTGNRIQPSLYLL